jgi:hypothetical protein
VQDLVVNGPFKQHIRKNCNTTVAANVAAQLKVDPNPTRVKVGLKMSELKPLLVDWIWGAWKRLHDDPTLLKRGFTLAKVRILQ